MMSKRLREIASVADTSAALGGFNMDDVNRALSFDEAVPAGMEDEEANLWGEVPELKPNKKIGGKLKKKSKFLQQVGTAVRNPKSANLNWGGLNPFSDEIFLTRR